MQKVHFSFVKDLKNFEFKELFVNIVTNIDNANIENDTIQALNTVLKSHIKPLRKLKSTNTSHPLTAVLNEKLATRTKCLSALRMAIDTSLLWYVPEVRVAAETLKPWLGRYKEHLYRTTISTQSNVVRSIMNDKNNDENIQEAITLLQLDGLLEEIEKLTNEISQTYLKRNSEIVHKKKIMTGLRKIACNDLQLLMNSIKVFYSTTTNNEEKKKLFKLNREINDDFITFRAKLLSRRTKSKNKIEINTAVEELIVSNQKVATTKDNSNLPMVIYDGLKIDGENETSTSKSLEQALDETRLVQKTIVKENNSNAEKGLNDIYLSKRDDKKGGGKLRPITRN